MKNTISPDKLDDGDKSINCYNCTNNFKHDFKEALKPIYSAVCSIRLFVVLSYFLIAGCAILICRLLG